MLKTLDGCACVFAMGDGKSTVMIRILRLPLGFIYKVKL